MKRLSSPLFALAACLPLLATAETSIYDICRNLIPDITQNFAVFDMEFMPNGNPHVSQQLVSCIYRATTHELYGNRPTMVAALLNISNNRFTVEIK